ncbi:MAG TPA: GNAT family N-acetyltransferase [Casimicrobiaceae bacterium]|nr:GNAT family N-acetyltransferase [Casimicrobiaceae bacterium]
MASTPIAESAIVECVTVDPQRVEEAALNALQTQRQLFYDGWLLRLSPGSAKRARSVNSHFGSWVPIDEKIDRCEAIYAAQKLPALFRVTPFCKPQALDAMLERRGYVAFDETFVQIAPVGHAAARRVDGVELAIASVDEFVTAVGALRKSTAMQSAAHYERLSNTPLAMHAVIARSGGGEIVGCGQLAIDDRLAGIYDMVTATDFRGRGVAKSIVAALLRHAARMGAAHAFLQVNADNAPARTVYARFGFATLYTYHYRARPSECF